MSTTEISAQAIPETAITEEDDRSQVEEFDADDIERLEALTRAQLAKNLRIHHHYDIGNQDIYVERIEGDVDGKRAALYCEFQCADWFGISATLSNLAVGALLCMFYGFRHMAVANSILESATDVDMFNDHQKMCGAGYHELIADSTLHRPGMREVMERLFHRA